MDDIECYAPTDDSIEVENDDSYSRLSTIIQSRPKRYITMVMGDLNVEVGSNNRGYEEFIGQQGLGEINEYWERFADFCASNSLVIDRRKYFSAP
jgi:hypothetical protein